MITLSTPEQAVIIEILNRYVPKAKILLFGSRIKGNAAPYSDLDLAIDNGEKLPLNLFYDIQIAFEESTLNFPVDVLDRYRTTPGFQQHILKHHHVFKIDIL